MNKLIIATGNKGKLKEFQNIFANTKYQIISQDEFNVPEVAETGLSFVENAILKARNAAKFCNYPCLADDSGICIPELNNRPGLYSARYAGTNTSYTEKILTLIKEIEANNLHRPKAFFYCALAIVQNPDDPCPIIATAKWEGEIQHEPSGNNGFGYDPIFYAPEFNMTAGEMDPKLKEQNCHRGIAIRKLMQLL
jgi:XTP/dITP diphosphohydrolase